jgi:hypothetical protein
MYIIVIYTNMLFIALSFDYVMYNEKISLRSGIYIVYYIGAMNGIQF